MSNLCSPASACTAATAGCKSQRRPNCDQSHLWGRVSATFLGCKVQLFLGFKAQLFVGSKVHGGALDRLGEECGARRVVGGSVCACVARGQ